MRYRFGLVAALTLVAGAAGAAPSVPNSEAEKALALLELAMDEAMAEFLETGPVDANWTQGGSDIEGDLAKLPGGKTGNYLQSVDKDGDFSLEIRSDGEVDALVPENWTTIHEIGDVDRVEEGSVLVLSLHGNYAIAVRGSSRRVGSAYCNGKFGGARLYHFDGPEGEKDLPPEAMLLIMEMSVQRIEKQPICNRYDRDGEGYRVRYFMEGGPTLPNVEEMAERAKLVRAGPVPELLGKK